MTDPQPHLIADIPHEDRPRERLLRCGPQALSDAELVAVLLRSGRPGTSVLDLSRELLADIGGLPRLSTRCARSLRRRGVGAVKVATLLAAVELARRIAAASLPDREPLSKPAAVAQYLHLRYGRFAQEVMGALYLCSGQRLTGEVELYRGTLTRATVEPRAILREGLLQGAAGVILFHTHPSGDATPSREDVVFTERMVKAGEVVGITVIDHLVVAQGGQWASIREGRW